MNILIVEDEEYKQKDLVDWFLASYPEFNLTIADTFRTARNILESSKFDVCVLDMTLPSFSKNVWIGAPESSALAGRRLINFIERTGVVDRVIVFTQHSTFSEYTEEVSYPDLVALLSKECPRVFAGAILYMVGDVGWKNQLNEFLKND